MSKVRIYDLAKELKLESKKILEDARRMGVDVSVPSNTLDDNIAAKIREMYYPKKEQAPAIHKARLIKHHTAPEAPAGVNAEQSAAAPATVEKAQQLTSSAEAAVPAQKAAPPVSQTTIKPLTPPKPAAPAPAKPAPTAQHQAAPGAEPKSRVVKLAAPPAPAKAEPRQEPAVEIGQAAPPARLLTRPPTRPPTGMDEELVAQPSAE